MGVLCGDALSVWISVPCVGVREQHVRVLRARMLVRASEVSNGCALRDRCGGVHVHIHAEAVFGVGV